MPDDAKFGCVIAVLGGSVQGYILCAINGAAEPLSVHFALSTTQRDLVVSIVILGALVGSVAGGTVCDVGGRRMGLVLAAACFTVGSVVMGLAPSFAVLLLGRVLSGVGIGFVGVAGPIYLVEMAPAAHRGTLVTANEIFLCVGCLVALVANLACSAAAHGWRWMLGASALPSLLMLCGASCVPETPVWLAQQLALSELRAPQAEREVAELLQEHAHPISRDEMRSRSEMPSSRSEMQISRSEMRSRREMPISESSEHLVVGLMASWPSPGQP